MNLRRNAIWNISEVAVTALTQFVIFGFIIVHLSIASLGVWSLVFSALSFARIADVGIAAGLVRYVARVPESGEGAIVPLTYVETALLTNCALYLVLGAIVFVPAQYALGMALHGARLDEARNLLPYAIASFVLLNLSSVTSSSLIGFKRSDLKSILSLIALGLQLGISWFSIQRFGLVGLAYAQIAQNAFMTIAGWILILAIQPGRLRFRFPYNLNVRAFIEMIGYGVRLQVLTMANFLYEPATKFILSAVAGPAALGLFEAAFRLVAQARALIVAPAQNLTPMFAAIGLAQAKDMELLYLRSTASIALVAVPGCILLTLASPLVSLLLLKQVQLSYISWVAIMSLGWFMNIVATPAYLIGVGTGHVRWNIIACTAAALGSLVLGYLLGHAFGSIGVVIASTVAIGAGGVIVVFGNCRIAGFDTVFPSFGDYAEALLHIKGAALRVFRSHASRHSYGR